MASCGCLSATAIDTPANGQRIDPSEDSGIDLTVAVFSKSHGLPADINAFLLHQAQAQLLTNTYVPHSLQNETNRRPIKPDRRSRHFQGRWKPASCKNTHGRPRAQVPECEHAVRGG
jgi:hypothetical protein